MTKPISTEQQIKEALAQVDYHGWSSYPEKDVTYKWLQYLLDKTDRLQKIVDAKYVSWNKGDEEERWKMQERNIELEEENTALRNALEDIKYQIEQSNHPAGLGVITTIKMTLSKEESTK